MYNIQLNTKVCLSISVAVAGLCPLASTRQGVSHRSYFCSCSVLFRSVLSSSPSLLSSFFFSILCSLFFHLSLFYSISVFSILSSPFKTVLFYSLLFLPRCFFAFLFFLSLSSPFCLLPFQQRVKKSYRPSHRYPSWVV